MKTIDEGVLYTFITKHWWNYGTAINEIDDDTLTKLLSLHEHHTRSMVDFYSWVARIKLVKKQRKNRCGWVSHLLNEEKYDEALEFDNILKQQDIDPREFFKAIHSILQEEDPKINTIWIVGVPNSGKTMITSLIASCFVSGYMSSAGSLSDFYYEPLQDSSFAVFEEPFCSPSVIEDMKSILAGGLISIGKKHSSKIPLIRTPIMMTGNYDNLSRGFAPPISEIAIRKRCFIFHFKNEVIPTLKITREGFITWYHVQTREFCKCEAAYSEDESSSWL